MTDWKARCAELADRLDDALTYTVQSDTERSMRQLIARTRAELAQPEPEGVSLAHWRGLCAEVLAFNNGEGCYNFSSLKPYDRDNAAFDAWQDIRQRLKSALAQPEPEGLPPRVGHILRLAEIIREVDGNHDKGAGALAEAILSHPGSRWRTRAELAQPYSDPTEERRLGYLKGLEDSAHAALAKPEPVAAVQWSEGICGNGAAILRDGVMVPIEEVVASLNRAEQRTAQPDPEGPSERIISIAKAVQKCAFGWEPDVQVIGNVCAEDVADLCSAVLVRYARPVIKPAPVAERFEFSVFNNEYEEQAGGAAPTYAQALSEGQHYLSEYSQDGPHSLEIRRVEVLPHYALPVPTSQESP
jgi:hypothetical protein